MKFNIIRQDDGKVFSGINRLPKGTASDDVTEGCIVLEGGAFRGLYGEGVLDALMEENINMECTIGVSAGAMNGMNYVSGQIGRSARANLKYRHDDRYVGAKAIRNNHGPIGFDFVFEEFPEEEEAFNEERFMRPEQRFIAVVTNCDTGKTEYMEKGKCSDIYQAIRASASMPYVSSMVEIDGKPYLDGGCSTNIAYQWALDQKFDKIVIVKTRPDFWRYEDTTPTKWAYRFYRTHPEFMRALEGKKVRYNRECDEVQELKDSGRAFVISPSRYLPVGRLERDMEKLGELYYIGYQDAKNQMNDLKEYLSGYGYYSLGERVGTAFKDGAKLK